MLKARLYNFSAGRSLLFSFIFTIIIGTFLLSLPISRTHEVPLIDLIFSATSATCVTGLSTISLTSFTFFGQCILLALLQIGGLGLVTLSFFIAFLFLNLGMTSRIMAGEILEFELWSKIRNFISVIISMTLCCEIIGAFLLFLRFKNIYAEEDALFYSFFYAISAFCNAGISIADNSLEPYKNDPFVLIILAILMLIGSIGFIVWYDIGKMIRDFLHIKRGKKLFTKLSLHSKIVLYSTFVLTLLGTLGFFILEQSNLLFDLTISNQWVNSFFMSLSSRGVGFTTFMLSHSRESTLFFFIPFMIIGASPGSTGSGIKTTTFFIFIATIISMMRGRKSVEVFDRTIPSEQVLKVMSLLTLWAAWIFFSTFLLLITESKAQFLDLLFESVSALGTCGFSTGITASLSFFGKILIIVTMLIGRIGTLTLVLALRTRKENKHVYKYPQERIMIG